MASVTLPTPLRVHAGGQSIVSAAGATVAEVLHDVVTQFPELKDRLFDGVEIRRFVNVYVNNEDIRFLDDLETAVLPEDEVSIIPAIAGG
jgi:molybdopterin converting factor small subunit